MFFGRIIFFSLLFFATLGFLFHVHLARLEVPICERPLTAALEAEQLRMCVSKDFWIPGKGGRAHATLIGEESQLKLVMRRGKVEGLEKLLKVRSQTSEGHCFTAREGIYTYPANHFSAIDATFESASLLKGKAHRIELPLTGSQVLCSGGVELDAEKERFHLEADEGFVNLGAGVSLQEVHCIGSVRLRRDDTFALAKQFDYLASEQLAILSCPLPERVLFWQQSAHLSAPEVRMILSSGKVEGVGDVHFSFNLEEQNLFDAIFAKYLNLDF